jgi:Hint domain
MTNTTLDGSAVPYLILAGTTQQANNGDELLALGTIVNLGEIFLNGTGGPFTAYPTSLSQFALLVLSSPTVTLDGNGIVLLSSSDPAEIVSTDPADTTLINAGETILGSGDLGPPGVAPIDANDTLYPFTLINQAGGVIDASGTVAESGTSQATFIPAQALSITNGSSVLVNAGLLEATGVGGLFVQSATIDQSGGGTILATGTGVAVSVSANDLIGGTLDATNGGTISVAEEGDLQFDGSTAPLTIGSGTDIEVTLIDASVDLLGTIDNQGTLGSGSPLILYTSTVTVSGGGQLLNPFVFGQGESLATFVNGDTVTGSGEIGVSGFIYVAPVIDHGIQQTGSAPIALHNLAGGVIDATGTLQSGSEDVGRGSIAGILLYNGGATSINDGLLEATGIQGLDINGGVLDQTGGGTLLASGTGVGIWLQSVDVIGGQIVSNNGGVIEFNAGADTLASTGAPITINAGGMLEVADSGVANVAAGTLTVIGSAIANAGTIIDDSTLILASPTVNVSGGGVILISGVLHENGTNVLINSDNTLTGTGDISGATLAVTNEAQGVINGTSLDLGETVVNAGLLENVTVGIDNATTIDNTGTGEILASGSGAIVALYDADIVGGTLAASGGGVIQLISASQSEPGVTLDGRGAAVTIAAGTTIQDVAYTLNDSGLVLLGDIDLLGTILGDLNIHTGPFAIPSAGVLRGSGTVSGYLSNTGTVLAQSGTLTVTNDVDGSGSIAITTGAAFVLGGESGETVNFGGGTNERLVLDTPSAFTGTLANLAVGDLIDLGTDNIQSANVAGNTLQLTLTNASTLDYTLSALASGATIVPVAPATSPEIFNFTYTGAAGPGYPGVSAQGSGSFTVLTAGGPVLSLANIVSFNLTLTVTKTGSGAGTDVITYTLPDLTSFAATLASGTLTTLSLGTDAGGYNHSVPVVTYETFQVADLANGGAATDVLNSNSIVTEGSIAVTPGQTVLSELQVQCFAEGTLIATPDGERAVETLRPGETVLVASGEIRDIVWIGRRRIDARHHPDPASVLPVRIAAGAFGPGLPRADLLLSPDHAVFVNGVLIPIRFLINHTTIARAPVDEVDYYHIELPSHDLLLAEGMAVESWLDTGDRSRFDNPGFTATRRRDLSGLQWEAMGCAPLTVTGPILDAARRLVDDRAAMIGWGDPAFA